jgi:hypothetical protein
LFVEPWKSKNVLELKLAFSIVAEHDLEVASLIEYDLEFASLVEYCPSFPLFVELGYCLVIYEILIATVSI